MTIDISYDDIKKAERYLINKGMDEEAAHDTVQTLGKILTGINLYYLEDDKDSAQALTKHPDLINYMSEDGMYKIPVEYTVYSTITVKADNLGDALSKAIAQKDSIPLQDVYEYVEDSFKFAVDEPEDALNAQCYKTVGQTVIE